MKHGLILIFSGQGIPRHAKNQLPHIKRVIMSHWKDQEGFIVHHLLDFDKTFLKALISDDSLRCWIHNMPVYLTFWASFVCPFLSFHSLCYKSPQGLTASIHHPWWCNAANCTIVSVSVDNLMTIFVTWFHGIFCILMNGMCSFKWNF